MIPSVDVVPETEPGTSQERRVLRAIRRIIRAVDLYSHRLTSDCGITIPQLACLTRVVEDGPLSLKSLAAAVDLSPSTLVGIVDRLERKGLLRRERSARDRRQVVITATESGVTLTAASPSPLHDRLARSLQQLPENEREVIAGSLERVVSMMAISSVDAAPILETGVSLATDIPSGAESSEATIAAVPDSAV